MYSTYRLILTTIFISVFASFAFSSGYGESSYKHHHHGHSYMDFQGMYDAMNLTAEQSALLNQIEASLQMLTDMQTNIMANSIQDDGEYDRSMMKEQWSQNSLVLEEHQAMMQSFKESLTDDQKSAWIEMAIAKKRSCQDKDD